MDQISILISYNDQLVEDPNMGEQVVGQRTKVMVVSRSLSYEGLIDLVNSIVRHNRDKYDVELQAITMGPKTTCRIDILNDNNVQFLLMEGSVMPQVCVTLVECRCAAANKDDQSMPNVEQSCDAANEMDQTRLLISYNGRWVKDSNMGEQYVAERAIGVVVSRSLSYEGLVHIINSIFRHNRDIYDIELQAITMGPMTTCRIDILDDNDVQFLLMESNVMPQVYVTLVQHRCAAANKYDQSMPNVEQSCDAASEMDETRLLISYNGQWVEDPNMGKQYVDQRDIGMVVSRSLSYKTLVHIVSSIVRHDRDIYDVELQTITMYARKTYRIDILDDHDVQFLLNERHVTPHVCVTLVQHGCAAATNAEERMDFARTRKLYKAFLDKDWETIKKDISADPDDEALLCPVTAKEGNNIAQLAVYSRSEEPLVQLLHSRLAKNLFSEANAQGNTVMHEAAICGNLQAMHLLASYKEELLEVKNESGETPLFRAVAFGNTKIVKYLANRAIFDMVKCDDGIEVLLPKLKHIHRKKKDGTTILHAAIQGRHFGTALELLKLDEELAEFEDENGINCLHLLADTPSAFKSGYQLGLSFQLVVVTMMTLTTSRRKMEI